ncbi:LysR family transcriptional regulator [Flaviflagellibacter deserti]|uniref:LysR family transcriptional regulator n=1 Tax=Flaviflagellibacter deserti TaxID=2267266 RepID=A0ABV9YZM7_9HYPH
MDSAQLHGLTAFVRVVEAGSFTAAAKLGGTTPSAVSKSIARLEKRLGVRLFQRTTRITVLTDEGQRYYEEVAPLLDALADAQDVLEPSRLTGGRLRVSLPADLGRILLDAITTRFVPQYPEILLDISLSDRRADILREGFDLALRLGTLEDSSLFARPLGTLVLALVASPAYLAAHGEPASPADLEQHSHIVYRLGGRPYPIRFADGRSFLPDARAAMEADSGEALRIAAVNGLGIAQLIMPTVQKDLDSGALARLLAGDALQPVPVNFIHAFERHMPKRAERFVEFIASTLSVARSR